jgi:hypothetical protein
MPKCDSIDKIVTSYFACVTAETFNYKGKQYEPKPLRVSPLLFRGYTCPANCGACCMRFSLDYLPEPLEKHPYTLTKRVVHFDGRRIIIYSDEQDDNRDHYCRNLRKEDGRCGIHGSHPFSCDFELIRFLRFANDDDLLISKLYGRGHAMKRIDGKRGAMCEMTDATPKTVDEVVRKLKRLKVWCNHFHLEHRVDLLLREIAILFDRETLSCPQFAI